MGLDCSHGAFNGAYTAFNRFRQAVAAAMGGSFPPHRDERLDRYSWYWGKEYNEQTHPGLKELLAHSDCDGDISPEMCVKVADELEALLPKIEALGWNAGGHLDQYGGYVGTAKKFIAGCRRAVAANQPLEFS